MALLLASGWLVLAAIATVLCAALGRAALHEDRDRGYLTPGR